MTTFVQPGVELLAHTPDPQRLIERAGRTCYASHSSEGPGSDVAFVRGLIARGHESVLEHASATLRITCDRGTMAELTRHRLASYSVQSTRYVDGRKRGLRFIEPPGLGAGAQVAFRAALAAAESAYLDLREAGVAPEIARAVLPNALATEIVATANLREWRHILHLRLAPAAHPQMREVARLILAELRDVAPVVFENFSIDS